jgi:transglutaminase-like putative cysteine protease
LHRWQLAQGRYFRRLLVCSLIAWIVAPGAFGQNGVIVHEYIPPDAAEDLTLGVLTPSGKMPATIRTPSGPVSAPDPFRSAQSTKAPTYGAAPPPSARFRIDGATSDPGTLHYHEPFRPSIAPFKRLRAFDAVNESFELVVWHATTHTVSLDNSPEAGQDEFFGDITVAGGHAVAIPSVAAGMRVLAADLEPSVPFQIAVDSAENWYFEAPTLISKARLVMRLAAYRAALSPEIVVNSYAKLSPTLPPVPPAVTRAAVPVLEQIGISRVASPTDAVRALVAYFRGFTPSTNHLASSASGELYQRLALSRKGVCRHRAYAFVVTALALGIPARFVHNEAHAWVEVFDGLVWHRIDLGGAAPSFQFDGETPEGAPYRMPADNYDWPVQAGSTTQSRMAASAQTASGQAVSSEIQAEQVPGMPSSQRAPLSQTEPPAPNQPSSKDKASSEPMPVDSARPVVPATAPEDMSVKFALKSKATLHRGEVLVLEGDVKPRAEGCGRARVDFMLRSAGVQRSLGSALGDERGHFILQTNVPSDVDVGHYEVTAAQSEPAACPDNSR